MANEPFSQVQCIIPIPVLLGIVKIADWTTVCALSKTCWLLYDFIHSNIPMVEAVHKLEMRGDYLICSIQWDKTRDLIYMSFEGLTEIHIVDMNSHTISPIDIKLLDSSLIMIQNEDPLRAIGFDVNDQTALRIVTLNQNREPLTDISPLAKFLIQYIIPSQFPIIYNQARNLLFFVRNRTFVSMNLASYQYCHTFVLDAHATNYVIKTNNDGTLEGMMGLGYDEILRFCENQSGRIEWNRFKSQFFNPTAVLDERDNRFVLLFHSHNLVILKKDEVITQIPLSPLPNNLLYVHAVRAIFPSKGPYFYLIVNLAEKCESGENDEIFTYFIMKILDRRRL